MVYYVLPGNSTINCLRGRVAGQYDDAKRQSAVSGLPEVRLSEMTKSFRSILCPHYRLRILVGLTQIIPLQS